MGQYGCLKILLQAFDKFYSIRDVFPCTDISGVHPYHLASKLSNSKCLQILLKHSLDSIDCQDKKKRTLLHWAVAHGAEENVHLLLKNGADTSLADEEGKVPLHYTALSLQEGTKGCLQALLGVLPSNVNRQDVNGLTPLHLSIVTNQKEKVELILGSKRGLINAVDNKQRTPIHYACDRGLLSITNCLISAGADINKKDIHGATPLHYAVLHNHMDVIKLMLVQSEFKDLATNDGETPIHWAAYVGANTALIHLKSHLGSLTRKDAKGKTPLHIAAQRDNASTSTIQVLLQMEAPINATDNDGCTPLHYAAQEGNLKIVKQLLSADQSCLCIKDEMGRNPMHYSVIKGHLHLTQIFIETGVPVDCCDLYGRTCLHLCSFLGYADVIYLLVEHKANVNARDNQGRTPLHWATIEGHLNAVNSLLEAKANANIIDRTDQRYTPLDYAMILNKKELIKALESGEAHSSLWTAAVCIQKSWRRYVWRKCVKRNRMETDKGFMPSKDAFRLLGEYDRRDVRESGTRHFREPERLPLPYWDVPSANDPDGNVILQPLLTPYFSFEVKDPEMNSYWEPARRFDGKSNNIVRNNSIGVSVRMPEGEEINIARAAYRKRLSLLTLNKIPPRQ